ncbi:Lactose permease [Paramyrothecium foliicola]|nr:Lactose permease [Paramyrothecium foliicola]
MADTVSFDTQVPSSSALEAGKVEFDETKISSVPRYSRCNHESAAINVRLGLDSLEPQWSLVGTLQGAGAHTPPGFQWETNDRNQYHSPFSWSTKTKLIALSGPFAASTLAAYSAGAYAMAFEPLKYEWQITDVMFNAGITLFVAGFGFAPMILAPMSEVYGRYWVFVGSGIVFFFGTLGCAVTDNYAAMLVSRFITGSGASVYATLTGGVVGDLYHKQNRNTPMALYSLSIMIGTGLGPLVSGLVVDAIGWRWIFYIQMIAIGTTTACIAMFFRETRSNVLLERLCQSLNGRQLKDHSSKPIAFYTNTDQIAKIGVSILWRSFAFPLRLLVTESVVFWFSLWVSFAWAILYMQFSSITIVFKSVYGFRSAQVGAVYTSVVAASIISALIAIYQDTVTRTLVRGRDIAGSPEERLLLPCFLSILLPAGLFWFGWSANENVTWVAPAVAIGSCTMGIFSIYLAVFNYLADTYQQYGSSALAAQNTDKMAQAPNTRPRHTVAELLAMDKTARFDLSPSLVHLYAILAPACLVVCATNGYDGSVLTGLQGVAAWQNQFGSPRGALLGFTSASYPLGAILSTPFSALISDRFGRRLSILVGSFIMMIGVVMQCASSTIGLFIGGRIVVGFGITLALAAAPILISELTHPRHRVFFGSLYNTSFYLGALLAGWVAFGSYRIPSAWAWRLPTLLQAGPAVIQSVFVFFLDESPRWLAYKDRTEEAFEILVKHHGNGNREDPLVLAEFWEMNEALRAERAIQSQGFKLFLSSSANRKRLAILITLAVFGQWSGNGLVSYYLTKILASIGIATQREQTMLNGVISTVNYATSIFAAFLCTKVGRRPVFIGGAIAMFLTFSALTTSIAVYNETGSKAASKSALAFIFIYYTSFNICLNPLLFLYPTEILPFRLRAMGLSILVFSTKAASFFNQFVNPIGMDRLGWKYYLVYVCWLLVEIAIFYFLYPETKGYTLERIQEAFGENKLGEDREKGELHDKVNLGKLDCLEDDGYAVGVEHPGHKMNA